MEISIITNKHKHLWWQYPNKPLTDDEKLLMCVYIPLIGPPEIFSIDQSWFNRVTDYIQVLLS